ncbi:MAG: CBS domain-containing protein [Pseudomonadales bacterium]|uniref:Inosine monophosphate dehydrogenase-related protein n=1 Tax=Oleiphilus messinensis TaxID=141451 RepID=A0A1Y0I696_9GAMM|nr:CBS domain-containing protein [Oleiphilus messinensis]ARU54964.1 inosine monophosphate dehydrogenase-related protein [Oleiphilus messinensis]MCG8612422.1 CBS domain-containing protein [Pseudomonadales bacterium]
MHSVKVRDYMTSNVLSFKPEDGVIEALRSLLKAGRSGAPVLDDDHKLVGVLSEIDCLKEALMGGYYQQAGDRVADHMSAEVDCVQADDDILVVADLFMKGRRRLPVMEEGRMVGIITRQDFARALIERIDHPHHGDN